MTDKNAKNVVSGPAKAWKTTEFSYSPLEEKGSEKTAYSLERSF
jgi:hypothetical protein